MPLTVEVRKDRGTIWITGTVRPVGAAQGVRVRRRAGTDNLKLAREEAAALEAEILRGAWHGERKADSHSFAEAALAYLKQEPRSAGTEAMVARLTTHFGEMPLSAINQDAVDKAREKVLRPGASPSTVKRNLIAPLRAILMHASKRDWCTMPRFDVPSDAKGRTRFMLPAEVERLRDAAAPHIKPLITFLVCTGCRMSEALGLDWSDVDLSPGGARVILWEGETKSDNRRVVWLSTATIAALSALPGRAGRVFLDHHGKPYRGSEEYGGQIKSAWATACRKAKLSGFGPHHLRHTWASWHYAMKRDLLLLKTDGGWSSVALVERYAHIMPSGHENEIRKVWEGGSDVGETTRISNMVSAR